MPFIKPARLAMGALTLLVTVAVSSAASLSQPAPANAGPGRLMIFGGRSPAQRASPAESKLDAALADLTRHAHLARADHQLEDLHALSPAARFARSGTGGGALVAIDAVTRGDPQELQAALVALGMQRVAVYGNDVGGYLPVEQISAAAARAEVLSLRAAMSRTRAAAPVTSEGDFAQGSATLRSAHGVSGAGITVGVLSDSFDCYSYYAANGFLSGGLEGYAQNGFTATAEQDKADGALPASVNVLQEANCAEYGQPLQLPFSDEGRALLQVVHDVAPGAGLAFYSASTTEAAFAYGITQLAAAGARVEADDVGFFDEPFFQDGLITHAIDTVTAQGVAYFTAAGNNSDLSYENTEPSFAQRATSGPNSGELLLNFDASRATSTTSLPISIGSLMNGEFVAIVVQWDQPYATSGQVGSGGGAANQIDVCLTAGPGSDVILNFDGSAATCSGANAYGTDPVQVLIIANPANSGIARTPAQTINLQIGLVSGSAPGRIKVVVDDDGAGSSIEQFQTNSPTIQGHANAANAGTLGAAFFANTPRCGVSPATPEWYTSTGGEPVLFDANGNPQTPETRQKPDFTGPDGVNTTFFGWAQGVPNDSSVSECRVNTAYPSFFGTSAATPHAAGVAALMLQYNPSLTPAQIFTFLRKTASPMGAVPNFQSGYGFIQADAAFAQIPAPPAGAARLAPASSSGGGGGGTVDATTLAALGMLLVLGSIRRRSRLPLLQCRERGEERGAIG